MPEKCLDCGQIISQSFHDCPGKKRDATATPQAEQTGSPVFIPCEHGTIGRCSECFNEPKED